MPTPQRISLIEAYDNRDVVAWLVRHSEEIKDLQTAVDALPGNDEFVLTIGDQTISGTKSFVNKIVAAGGIEADTLVKINADLQVFGDIYQNGSAYDTHAEQLYTTKDYILMRDGAVTGLAPGAMSGLEIIKYDGTNNLRLAADDSGVARIGDVGDEQPLLTRAEAADLTDGAPLLWDAAENKAVSGSCIKTMNGESPDSYGNFQIAAGEGLSVQLGTNSIIISSTGGTSEWVKRTANDDWSDLFNITADNKVEVKNDMIIYYGGDSFTIMSYLPKGLTETEIKIPTNKMSNGTSSMNFYTYLSISRTKIPSTASTVKANYNKYTFAISGSAVQITQSQTDVDIPKANLQIFVR